MASIMKVLLLLLLVDAPAEAEKKEAAVAPADAAAHIPGFWKLQMKELKGKGEMGKASVTLFCVT